MKYLREGVPNAHYGFALTRTDGGPPWVVYPGCDRGNNNCSDPGIATERAEALIKVPGIKQVRVVRVTYSIMEVITDD